jgi:hypothetical protein
MILIALFLSVLIGFACGVIAERRVNEKKLELLKNSHQAELRNYHSSAFEAGWRDSLASPLRVKNKYEEYFGKTQK